LSLHFPILLRFSRDFTRISKCVLLLKMYFYAGTPRTFQSLTNLAFLCTQTLRKISILTHRPSRRRVGSPAAIAGRPWPSSGTEPPRGSPRVEWRGRLAWRQLRRGREAAAAVGCGSGGGGAMPSDGEGRTGEFVGR
jgi:hypothetical protein